LTTKRCLSSNELKFMPMLVWAQEQHIEMGTALGEEVPNVHGRGPATPASVGDQAAGDNERRDSELDREALEHCS
jgi:hypothetical protein